MAEGWEKVHSILSWKEPKLSGLVFGCLNLVFYLIVFGDCSLIEILSYICLSNLVVVFIYQTINPSTFPDDEYEFVSREVLEDLIAFGNDLFHKTFGKIYSLKSTENVIQVLLALFIATFVSGLFSTAGFLWLATILAFVVPIAYSSQKEQVDSQIQFVKGNWDGVKNQVKAMIPKARSCQRD
ncbi:unnamed protein product [Blepharisma stoltei]|uniref:Reticulon-like protein n=1 Tax=Blepharisma stoltei TaxID=1481888 RepID=A0AAU9JN38_9CILI|nr:unnamed protein product [Blepharisma stoltei]